MEQLILCDSGAASVLISALFCGYFPILQTHSAKHQASAGCHALDQTDAQKLLLVVSMALSLVVLPRSLSVHCSGSQARCRLHGHIIFAFSNYSILLSYQAVFCKTRKIFFVLLLTLLTNNVSILQRCSAASLDDDAC